MEQEVCQIHEFNTLILANYQQLVENIKKRDNIIQGQMDCLEARLGRHRCDIEGHQRNIDQLSEDQVSIVARMVGYEEKACCCGNQSEWLSNMSYGEPAVAEGPSFCGALSPSPVPIPPPVPSVQAQDIAIPSLSSSSSSLGPSSKGSFESAQPVVIELVEIVEVDLEVDSEDAQALSDRMDKEVRSCLQQHCKSKQHPERFAPFPKGWKACGQARGAQKSFQ